MEINQCQILLIKILGHLFVIYLLAEKLVFIRSDAVVSQESVLPTNLVPALRRLPLIGLFIYDICTFSKFQLLFKAFFTFFLFHIMGCCFVMYVYMYSVFSVEVYYFFFLLGQNRHIFVRRSLTPTYFKRATNRQKPGNTEKKLFTTPKSEKQPKEKSMTEEKAKEDILE